MLAQGEQVTIFFFALVSGVCRQGSIPLSCELKKIVGWIGVAHTTWEQHILGVAMNASGITRLLFRFSTLSGLDHQDRGSPPRGFLFYTHAPLRWATSGVM
jgi:hypothetical protein